MMRSCLLRQTELAPSSIGRLGDMERTRRGRSSLRRADGPGIGLNATLLAPPFQGVLILDIEHGGMKRNVTERFAVIQVAADSLTILEAFTPRLRFPSFGTRGSELRILSLRPFKSKT